MKLQSLKWILYSLLLSLLLYPLTGYAQKHKRDLDPAQLQALKELNQNTRPDWRVRFTSDGPVPNFLVGGTTEPIQAEPVEASKRFLNLTRSIFRIRNAQEEFTLQSVNKDQQGGYHVKLNQFAGGLPVFGAQMIVHGDPEGRIWMANGHYYPNKVENFTPGLSAESAIAKALDHMGITRADLAGPDSCILGFYPQSDSIRLAYQVVIFTRGEKAGFHEMVYYVDALSGDIFISYDNIKTEIPATGIGYGTREIKRNLNLTINEGNYYLRDISRRQGMNGLMSSDQSIVLYDAQGSLLDNIINVNRLSQFSSSDSVFKGNKVIQAAVDAHNFLGLIYDYYFKVHGWNSWDNNGGGIIAVVNIGGGVNGFPNNAFWAGDYQSMFFGLGDGKEYYPFSAALDVVAHEFQHAVTQATADLIYQGQSGALNESFSDIFAVMIDRDDWLCGEDLYIGGGYLRNIADPSANGDPDHMSEYIYTTEDYGGVHLNMLIPGKAYYLMSEGGVFEGVNVTGFGREKLEKILFYTLVNILTKTSNFEDAREATIQAAKKLYGETSTEAQNIEKAWSAVGIGLTGNVNPALPSPNNLLLSLKERGVELKWSPPVLQPLPGTGMEVSGTLSRSDGGTVEGTYVLLLDESMGNIIDWQLLTSNGIFKFTNVVSGRYILSAYLDINSNGKLDPQDWLGFLDSNADGIPDILNVDRNLIGLSIKMFLYGSLGNAKVSGNVVRYDGGSVAGGVVGLVGQEASGYETENVYQQELNATGKFEFKDVAPGNYMLLSVIDSDSNGELGDGDYIGFYDANFDFEPDILELDPNEELTGIMFSLFRLSLMESEVEPNDYFVLADKVSIGGGIKGSIYPMFDVDIFVFTVDKAMTVEIDIDAQSIGSSLDAAIGLYDVSGNLLAASTDADGLDPRLTYSFPSAGTYYIGVIDLFTTGDYELRLHELKGSVSNNFKIDDHSAFGSSRGRLISLGKKAAKPPLNAVKITPLGLVKKRGINALRPSGLGLLNKVLNDSEYFTFNTILGQAGQANEPPTGYRIYRSTNANFDISRPYLIAEVPDTIWIDRNTVNRQRYYYKVTAAYSSGESGPSNTLSILFQFTDQPSIALSDTTIAFGEVALDSSARKSFMIKNAGTAALEISGISSDNEAFRPVVTSFSLPAGESRQVEVVFRPNLSGSYQGILTVFSNDYINPKLSLFITGEGIARKIILLGDVNNDGTVNILDALLILSGISGLTLPQGVNLSWGDVDGNGITDKTDATLVMSYAIGLPTPYPIGLPIGTKAATALASNNQREITSGLTVPKNLLQPAELNNIGQLLFYITLAEKGESINWSSAACLYEICWDPAKLIFEQLQTVEKNGNSIEAHVIEKGRLVFGIAMPRGISQNSKLKLIFSSQQNISSGKANDAMIAVSCLEQFSSSFEKITAYKNEEAKLVNLPQACKLTLYQNFPNPFNPSTDIRFYIPEGYDYRAITSLEIFNIKGIRVRTLISNELLPGDYCVTWNGKDENGSTVASGVYFYRLRCGSEMITRKMVVIK